MKKSRFLKKNPKKRYTNKRGKRLLMLYSTYFFLTTTVVLVIMRKIQKESFTEEALESVYDDVDGSPFTEGHIASVFEYISNEYESNNKHKNHILYIRIKNGNIELIISL